MIEISKIENLKYVYHRILNQIFDVRLKLHICFFLKEGPYMLLSL